jgi:hypothetical protein
MWRGHQRCVGHLVTIFYTKPSGSCHTKGHRAKKVLLRNNTFYIKHTRAGQARFEPSLAWLLISDNQDVDDLLSKDKAFVEWAAYFGGLQAKAEHSPYARSPAAVWNHGKRSKLQPLSLSLKQINL